MNNVQQEMKDAVNSGYWNLYRYSPETKTFTLDSKEPTMPLYDFMKGEVRYASLELSFPENAKVLFAEAEAPAIRSGRFFLYLRLPYAEKGGGSRVPDRRGIQGGNNLFR